MRRAIVSAAAIAAAAALYVGLRSTPTKTPDTVPKPNHAVGVSGECAATGVPDYFFPAKSFEPWDDGYPDAPRIYYSLFLTAMGEPSLWCGPAIDEAYRLIRLQRNGVPLGVRVERRGTGTQLTWVKLEAPAWALPPNGVMARGARQISDAELALVRSAYSVAEFWQLPMADPSPEATSTAWLLEARVGSHYRGVVRHPFPGVYRAAGLVLMELAGIGEAELAPDAPGVTFRPRHPQTIPGLPPAPEPPPPPPAGDPWGQPAPK